MTLDIDKLRALVDVLVERDIAEFEHESEGERVRIVRGTRVAAAPPGPYPQFPGHPQLSMGGPSQATSSGHDGSPGSAPSSAPADDSIEITSPFVGTFYRSPSPDAPAFVDVGSVIRPGQTLCIIEAMKLMNEIEAECSGTITEVFVQNGKSVEFGQKLYRVKKA